MRFPVPVYSIAKRIVAAVLVFGLVGLAMAAPKGKSKKTEPKLAWPPPPNEERIVYVQSIQRPSDVGIKGSALTRFGRWLTGSEKGDEGLMKPFGIAVDEKDNICITDTGANAVCYFDRAKSKWKRWDKIGKLSFASPVAVAIKNGTIFVVDSALSAVVAFNESDKLVFLTTNKLERPSGIAISGDRFFVTDSKRQCVVVFDLNGKYVSEFGKRGTANGEFNFPTHITVDRTGKLFITDSMNGRIQVFNRNGVFEKAIGSVGNSTGQFSRPKGVAVDSFDHVYVVDGLFDHLQIFNSKGQFLLTLGESGSNRGEFWLPNGIVITHQDEIFVADSYNRRLQVLKYVGGP